MSSFPWELYHHRTTPWYRVAAKQTTAPKLTGIPLLKYDIETVDRVGMKHQHYLEEKRETNEVESFADRRP